MKAQQVHPYVTVPDLLSACLSPFNMHQTLYPEGLWLAAVASG
jgi:hypothetical protein